MFVLIRGCRYTDFIVMTILTFQTDGRWVRSSTSSPR